MKGHGLHHMHLRKRAHRKHLEPIPARSTWLRALDRIVLAAGVMGPLTTVPQILKIYILQDATGVSSTAWLLGALLDIPWIIYGFVHHERPIIVAYTMWLIMNSLVFIGAIIYGAGAF